MSWSTTCLLPLALCAPLLAACSGDACARQSDCASELVCRAGSCVAPPVTDSGSDADVMDGDVMDGDVDASVDANMPDATMDAGDASMDAGDAALDGAADAAVDAGDGAVDGAVDAGDAALDGAADAAVDAGDAAADASMDAAG